MNKVAIYGVKRVDMAGKVLQENIVSETEAIDYLTNRNDLHENLTEQDIIQSFDKIKFNFKNNLNTTLFFLNDNQTIADVYFMIEERVLH